MWYNSLGLNQAYSLLRQTDHAKGVRLCRIMRMRWLCLIPPSMCGTGKFEITTPEVKITVAPENSYLIEARMIGGRRYLLIPADDGVEVNGVSVNIPNEEHN